MDLLSFLDVFSSVDEAIAILEKYKTKLIGDYDTAYLKLDEAMDEIDKMVDSILTWLKKFIYLNLNEADEDLSDEARRAKLKLLLLDFEMNAMTKNIEKSRGHCFRVGNIYNKYLENFFSKKLNSKELEDARHAFLILGNMDGSLYTAMERLCEFLSQNASQLNQLLDDGKSMEDIRKEHETTKEELLQIYKQVSGTMERMYKVRNWFIQIAEIA
jgi:hypothetical protein